MKLTINFTLYPLHIAFLYLIALAGAELITALSDPYIGLTIHALILTILVFHTAVSWHDPGHRFLMTLIVAPLIRIISLSMPLVTFSLSYWFLIVSLPLFITIFLIIRTLGFSWHGLGLNARKLPIQLLIIPTGFLFGYIEYLILRPEPLIESFTWQQFVIPALILLISSGFFEELSFRGMMQSTAMETFGRFGILYIALLFAVLHIGHKSVLDVLFIFGVGLFFGWVAIKTGSIVGITLSHGLLNISLFLIMPFLFATTLSPNDTAIDNTPSPSAALRPTEEPPMTSTPTSLGTAIAIVPLTPSPRPTATPTAIRDEPLATTVPVLINPVTATATTNPIAGVEQPPQSIERKEIEGVPILDSGTIPIGIGQRATPQSQTGAVQPSETLRNIPYLQYENGVFIYSIAAHLLPTSDIPSVPGDTGLETIMPLSPIFPQDGYAPIQRLVSFHWQTELVLAPNQRFAVVFWQQDQTPFSSQFGILAPEGLNEVSIDFVQLRTLLKDQFEPGEYQWGVLLIQEETTYLQRAYLGGEHRIQLD